MRQFVDPDARILFFPHAKVFSEAYKFDTIAFDIKGCKFRHRGPLCTFDVLLKRFGLQSHALNQIAQLIPAAEPNQTNAIPQARGLLAPSIGMSKL